MLCLYEIIQAIREDLLAMRSRSQTFIDYYKVFNMTHEDLSNLELTEKECESRYNIWKGLHDWETMTKKWLQSNAKGLDLEEIQTVTDETTRNVS